MADPVPGTLPSVPRLAVPLVRTPTCPDHCSGKHHVEALLACTVCEAPAFRLVAHEWAHADGMYFYSTEPMNGMPAGATVCPRCEAPLTRRRA